MIQKIMHKNIIGVFILVTILGVFSLKDVYADSADQCSEKSIASRYDSITSKVSGETGNKVTISTKNIPNSLIVKDGKKVKFTLKSVSFDLKSENGKVSGSNIININNPMTITGQNDIVVSLNDIKSDLSNVDSALFYFDIENDTKCNGTITFELLVEGIGRGEKIETPQIDFSGISNIATSNEINCSNPADNFQAAFCHAKSKATTYDVKTSPSVSLTCNYKDAYDSSELKGDCYYKNIKYLYGKKETSYNVGSYKYHFNPTGTAKTENITCKRTCEEAVEVKYGPPVASKAGLCFEYKVKVVSRVSCHTGAEIPKPKAYKVCTPYPVCKSGYGVYNQGGPNEDFDDCIKACDGGKYTKSCSNKCYKKVYKKSNKLSNNLAVNYATKLANTENRSLIDNNYTCNGENCYGYYYKSGGSVNWYGKKGKNVGIVDRNGITQYSINYAPGRWYYYNSWGLTPTYHVYSRNGIYKAPDCSDSCYWAGCSSDEAYLNYKSFEWDRDDNLEIYKDAINKCKAAASCSESTAEFTIEADYKSGGKVKTVKFPYSTEKDKITSTKTGWASDTKSTKNTTFIEDGFDCKTEKTTNCNTTAETNCDLPKGCYDQGTKYTDRYRATWSFPGTWVNLKTGEISFVDLDSSGAWFKQKKKFCVPLDAEDVNQKWWNYYYKIKTKGITLSTDDKEISDQCNSSLSSANSVSEKDIEWNIRAATKGFGYFKWNINISCFYALSSSNGVTADNDKSNDKCETCSGEDCYRIRSVDLNNLFPDKDGDALADKNGTGRSPGFNWSTYANTNNGKNNNKYLSTPDMLIKKIQNLGDGVYTDENLDYEFNLSPSDLRNMRKTKEGNGDNYTNFDNSGFYIDENGVGRYVSKKIRSINGEKKIPDKSSKALNCNNMKNYSSSQCDN